MPRGLTAIRLLLAGLCVATLGIAYSMARPSAEAAREVGSAPVPVEEPTYEVPGLGRAAKLPALAAPLPRPAPAPVPVEQPQPVRSVPVHRPRRRAQPSNASVAPPAAAPSAPVSAPAPPPPPAPVYEPPSQPPPPAQQPDVVTFDDSG